MNKSIFRINLFILIFFMIFAIFSGLPQRLLPDDQFLLIFFVRNVLFLLLPAIIYVVIYKLDFSDSIMLKSINLKSILLVIGFSFAIQPFTMLLSAISNVFFSNKLAVEMGPMLERPLWYLFIMIAVLPAIFEEIPTRGLILSQYGKTDIRLIALVNGFIFGAIHLNFQQFVYAFTLGFIFVYIVKLTGSVLSSMLAHLIINGTQVVLMKVGGTQDPAKIAEVTEMFGDKLALIQIGSLSIMTLIFTPLAILCIYGLGKVNGTSHFLTFRRQREESLVPTYGTRIEPEEKTPVDILSMVPFFITVILFVALGILVEFVAK